MNTWVKAMIAGAILLGGLNTALLAKTCECQQQKASATGKDSCSLSESKDYCNISFSGAASSSPDNSGAMEPAIFDDMVKKLSANKQSRLFSLIFRSNDLCSIKGTLPVQNLPALL